MQSTGESAHAAAQAPPLHAERPSPRAGHRRRAMEARAVTHQGPREHNEDRHLVREDLGLVIVADGWSGAPGGEEAARIAVAEVGSCLGASEEEETLPNLEDEDMSAGRAAATVSFALGHGHRRVRHHGKRTGRITMGCDVAVLVVDGPRIVIGQAGNVRVYRSRGGELETLTQEGAPVDAGMTGLGGGRPGIQPRVRAEEWIPGDLYVIMTSGMHRAIDGRSVRCALATCENVGLCATAMMGSALHGGAMDNATVVVLRPQQER